MEFFTPNIGQRFGLLIPKIRFHRFDWLRWMLVFATIHLMASLYITVPENFLYIAVFKFSFFYCCDVIVHTLFVLTSYTIVWDTWLKRRYLVEFHSIASRIAGIIKSSGLPVHKYEKRERREFLENILMTLVVCTTLDVVHLTKIYSLDHIWFNGDLFCTISSTFIRLTICTFVNYLTVLKSRKRMFEELMGTFCARTQWQHNGNRRRLRRELRVLRKLYVLLWTCNDQLNAYFGRIHVVMVATLWWYTTLNVFYAVMRARSQTLLALVMYVAPSMTLFLLFNIRCVSYSSIETKRKLFETLLEVSQNRFCYEVLKDELSKFQTIACHSSFELRANGFFILDSENFKSLILATIVNVFFITSMD